MNPLLITLGLRALKLLIEIPKLRSKLSADVAAEGQDVSPAVVSALAGNREAIQLLDREIDEALDENAQIRQRLEERKRREGSLE